MAEQLRTHFILRSNGRQETYRAHGKPVTESPPPPPDGRAAQYNRLYQRLSNAYASATAISKDYRNPEIAKGDGVYLDFTIKADYFDPARVENAPKNISLRSARYSAADKITATVYVPQPAESFFYARLNEYMTKERNSGKPYHQKFVDSLVDIAFGRPASLWTDPTSPYPDDNEGHLWEVWTVDARDNHFCSVAETFGVDVDPPLIRFPERYVRYVKANREQIEMIVYNCDAVAELRATHEPMIPDVELADTDIQIDKNLLERIDAPGEGCPYVCLIDSGVNRQHPLIEPWLAENHWQSAVASSSAADRAGHGTPMAGIALYGDLRRHLASGDQIVLTHRLESVNIHHPGTADESRECAFLTKNAVYLAEIENPKAQRVYCLAACFDSEHAGQPTLWSSTIDSLCAGAEDRVQRLMVVAAGNLQSGGRMVLSLPVADYQSVNETDYIREPGQSWNALTIGAHTLYTDIFDSSYAGWQVLAPAGDLSPYSRTSIAWDKGTARKPDVVFEGGNFAHDGTTARNIDDLQLISTRANFESAWLQPFFATSAATAEGARFAAQIESRYPDLRPETVRALVVHSASWTEAMRARFGANQDTRRLGLQRYGYGVPTGSLALESSATSATIAIEAELQPYIREDGREKTNKMAFHELPWPRDTFLKLGATLIEVRVTLSYFIEPNAAQRSFPKKGRRYPYQSHGLRFELQRFMEDMNAFDYRVSAARAPEGYHVPEPAPEDQWYFGSFRNSGSVHSDFVTGTAASFADRSAIVVYPSGTGWWRELKSQAKFNAKAPYSLIVSVRALEALPEEIDLAAAFELAIEAKAKISAEAPVPIEIETPE